MEFEELKIILRRLYNDYVKFHLKTILFCLFLSILVAGSTSATAWLLDPAVKKIFVEKDQTLAWLIPIAIVLAFSTKGVSLYFARLNILKVGKSTLELAVNDFKATSFGLSGPESSLPTGSEVIIIKVPLKIGLVVL